MVFGHAVVRNALLCSTTHHKERLDPGRMDMHIHLSYCNFSAFEQLAFNYLGISQHKLFEQIEGLLREVKVIGEGIQDINFSTARKCAVNWLELQEYIHELGRDNLWYDKVLKWLNITNLS